MLILTNIINNLLYRYILYNISNKNETELF